ncbi:hypothetical protein, partial [Mesobacillus zeae]
VGLVDISQQMVDIRSKLIDLAQRMVDIWRKLVDITKIQPTTNEQELPPNRKPLYKQQILQKATTRIIQVGSCCSCSWLY